MKIWLTETVNFNLYLLLHTITTELVKRLENLRQIQY